MMRSGTAGILATGLALLALGGGACGGGGDPTDTTGTPDLPGDAVEVATDEGAGDETGLRPDVAEEAANPDANGEVPACPDGQACDDGDPCTFGDACRDGECRGTAATGCDDGIACTLDACTAATECTHDVKPGWCLVDGACFEDGQADPSNACQACVTAVASDRFLPDDSLPCDDGNDCTGGDTCHNGACVPGQVSCDDGDPCTNDVCEDGQCVNYALTGAACDDGDPCTGPDTCDSGSCAGAALDCDDGNPCTGDSCSAETGGCVHEFLEGECEDGNLCTVGERCVQGECVAGEDRLDCEDGNPCTDDGCVPAKGCVWLPNTAPCDDGDPCTLGDTCRQNACEAGREPRVCDDENPCTDDSCKAGVGCIAIPNAESCEDGNPCTVGDTCGDGACQSGSGDLNCNDDDPCTDDYCVAGEGCGHWFNTSPCDDGNVCTQGDTCQGDGACKGVVPPDYCADYDMTGNPITCTIDTCSPTEGCKHKVDNRPECRPQIVIDFPPRGATLDTSSVLEGTAKTIRVRGHVDPGVDGLVFPPAMTINGEPVYPSPIDFSFTHDIDSAQGFNPIVVDAIDQRPGLETLKDHLVQSYYYSTQWYPVDAAAPAQSMVPDGLMLFLGPEVWDDNDTGDTDDLATILTLYLQNMNLGAMIPRPATSGTVCLLEVAGHCVTECDYDVYINNVRYSGVAIDLVPMEGGLHLGVTFRNFAADIDIDGCGSPSGNVSASSIRVDADLMITVDAGGTPVITMANTVAVVNGLDVDLDGVLGFLANWILDFFEDDFADTLEDAIRDQIEAIVPKLQEALAGLALNQDFTVPSLIPDGADTTLGLRSVISTFACHVTGCTVGLKATIVAPHGVQHQVLGSIGRAACLSGLPEPVPAYPVGSPVPTVPALELGLHDDFFNQVPFALFWAGVLTLPIPESMLGGVDLSSYNITDLAVSLDLWLPPILSTCNDQAALRLQIGDLGVRIDMKLFGVPVQMQIYASLEAAARLEAVDGANGKELSIAIDEPTFLDLEIASLAGGLVGAEDSLGTLIREQLIPKVLESMTGKALGSFPIPEIDLSGMIDGLPPDTKIAIEIREVLRDHAYSVLSGTVK